MSYYIIDIRNNHFEKYYLAKTYGQIKRSGSINVNIKKDEKNKKAIICKDGKLSTLDYNVISYDNNQTYVNVNLHTGRYNQIRVSFSHIGYPLVNDNKYGTCKPNNDSLGLWCYKIVINHPVTKERLTFKVEPPKTNSPWKIFDTSVTVKPTL